MVKDFESKVKPFARAKREEPSSVAQAVEVPESQVVESEPVAKPEVKQKFEPESRPAPVWRQPVAQVSSEEQEKRVKAHRKKEAQYTDATTIRLSPEVYRALKYASFDMGVPMWAIVNEALHCVLVEPGEFDWERARYVAKHF